MRSPSLHRALALGVAFAASLSGACGGVQPGGAAPSPTSSAAPARSNSDVITADDLRTGEFRDVYQAVERLRPQFLRPRGATSARTGVGEETLPVVFMDEQRLGGLSTMRGLPIDNVREIRYVAARDATTRWGTGYTGGAIVIVSRGR